MEDMMPTRNSGSLYLGRTALRTLKMCPLCGAVNSRLNSECFVCRWHGSFELDEHVIENAVRTLIDQCPELLEDAVFLGVGPPSWKDRMHLAVWRFISFQWLRRSSSSNRRIDYRV